MAHTAEDHAEIARLAAVSTLTSGRAVAAFARAARWAGRGFVECRACGVNLFYGDRPFANGEMPGWVGA